MTKKKPKIKEPVQSLENTKSNNKKRHPPNCRCKFCGTFLNLIYHSYVCNGPKCICVLISVLKEHHSEQPIRNPSMSATVMEEKPLMYSLRWMAKPNFCARSVYEQIISFI